MKRPDAVINLEHPEEFCCLFKGELMQDPVMVIVGEKGYVYDRPAITAWFALHDTNPSTNEVVDSKKLISCVELKNRIVAYKASLAGAPVVPAEQAAVAPRDVQVAPLPVNYYSALEFYDFEKDLKRAELALSEVSTSIRFSLEQLRKLMINDAKLGVMILQNPDFADRIQGQAKIDFLMLFHEKFNLFDSQVIPFNSLVRFLDQKCLLLLVEQSPVFTSQKVDHAPLAMPLLGDEDLWPTLSAKQWAWMFASWSLCDGLLAGKDSKFPTLRQLPAIAFGVFYQSLVTHKRAPNVEHKAAIHAFLTDAALCSRLNELDIFDPSRVTEYAPAYFIALARNEAILSRLNNNTLGVFYTALLHRWGDNSCGQVSFRDSIFLVLGNDPLKGRIPVVSIFDPQQAVAYVYEYLLTLAQQDELINRFDASTRLVMARQIFIGYRDTWKMHDPSLIPEKQTAINKLRQGILPAAFTPQDVCIYYTLFPKEGLQFSEEIPLLQQLTSAEKINLALINQACFLTLYYQGGLMETLDFAKLQQLTSLYKDFFAHQDIAVHEESAYRNFARSIIESIQAGSNAKVRQTEIASYAIKHCPDTALVLVRENLWQQAAKPNLLLLNLCKKFNNVRSWVVANIDLKGVNNLEADAKANKLTETYELLVKEQRLKKSIPALVAQAGQRGAGSNNNGHNDNNAVVSKRK